MASHNADFSDYQKIVPTFEEPPPQRGCFFYGCLIAIVLSLLLLVAVAVLAFLAYRWIGSVVDEYTATAPRELPRVEMPEDRRAALKERVDAFRSAIKQGRATPPLVLSSDEVNALIEDDDLLKDLKDEDAGLLKDLKGKVYVQIEKDKLKGQVSIPLSNVPLFGLTQGRFLNGEAEFKVSLRDGLLLVNLDSIEVNGKQLPAEAMNGLRQQNLAQDVYKDQKKVEELRKFESIEIEDGKLIIKARDRTKAQEVVPDALEPAPSKGAGPLPDNVLAPPESRPAAPAGP